MPKQDLLTVRGWDVLRLSTEELQVDIVPGLGGTIVSLQRRSDDLELLWQTPWGLRLRGAAGLPGDAEAAMMDSFAGGWQSQFPNGGDTAISHGVEWGYDGEARIAPFDWEWSNDLLIMKTRLVRTPFTMTKIISLDGGQLTVAETVHNVGTERLEVMWGQQLVFGAPLISDQTVIESASTIVHPDPTLVTGANYDDIMPWPRTVGPKSMINLKYLPAPGAEESRQVYLAEFDAPRISVNRPDLDLRVDLDWDLGAWPYTTYSLEAGRRRGFPWYGAGYFLALQPGSSWPSHGLHDARRISKSTLWCEPGQARTSHLRLSVS